ncbi:hypothetical protein CCR94_13385 [Rhodoblastus sphagnicola]|uniref:Uncharacterized protein n=1 Tax=Rhodoblastus sphagnicola TaxID=333368 RepID=A0A2S6N6R1_9HYPH|nr:hypothetical protein [Rhodoblastus sphagnicola]MBB4197581.1 hypothetical protein [Rhodoblastus sphagnicola]PPQ30305.1 hypothetical protein CCR94_13385 [Rhodoblastus sphagnicola]
MRATFEQNAEFITLASREARDEAQRLLARLEILISGLAAKDSGAGLELRRAAVEFLVAAGDQAALRGEGRLAVVPPSRPSDRVSDRPSDRLGELESTILEIFEDEEGLHVDAIFELLGVLGVEITKGNLSVKLHRMIKAGRLISTARGCYGLSSMERARRMAS